MTRSNTAQDYEGFYRRNYVPALRYVLAHTHHADAEAIVAEAFLLAWQRWPEAEVSRAWLFSVLRHKVGDHYRLARTQRDQLVAEPPLAPINDDTEATATQLDVRRALSRLKPHYAQALVLSYWADLTTAEAAQVAGVSQVTYRVRLTRAKKALLQALEGETCQI